MPGKGKASLSFGGVYAFSNLGYDYKYTEPYYYETLTIADTLPGKSIPGFSVAGGYFFSGKVEAFVGVSFINTRSHGGRVSISVPSQVYAHEVATGADLQSRRSSLFDLLVGAKFHPSVASRVDPYLGFGGCYSHASVEFMSDAFYADDYTPLTWFHDVTITQVDFEKVRARALGGFVLGGLGVGLGPRLSLYAEGLYKFAKKSVLHPFSSAIGSPENITVSMGGFSGSIGLRVYF